MAEEKEKLTTHPVINGACYVHAITGEEAVIMGTHIDPNSNKKIGNLYTFARGPLPSQVIEDSESMKQWTLYSAPSKKTATGLLAAASRAKND